jgi:hypothetical protein
MAEGRYSEETAGYRDAAKWIVGSFSALAALIVGASSFSDLGAMAFGVQFWIALSGILFALALVTLVIFLCTAVLTPTPLNLADLRIRWRYRWVKRWIDRHGGGANLPGGSVDGLIDQYRNAQDQVNAASAAHNQAQFDAGEALLDQLQPHINNVTDALKLRLVTAAFGRLILAVELSILPIAIALYVFLWATSSAHQAADSPSPQAQTFALSAYGKTLLTDAGVGNACMRAQVTLILYKALPFGGAEAFTVPPDPTCGSVRVQIPDLQKFGTPQ